MILKRGAYLGSGSSGDPADKGGIRSLHQTEVFQPLADLGRARLSYGRAVNLRLIFRLRCLGLTRKFYSAILDVVLLS